MREITWCKKCGRKWAQDRTRLCRTCLKAEGQFYGVLEMERRRLEERLARGRYRHVPPEDLLPRPDLEKVIDGVHYFVTWDGA